MPRPLFACDLDNTLLYSRRHVPEGASGDAGFVCVERLEGRDQGFFSRRTIVLLREVVRRVLFAPVTTRSVDQYRRIVWPEGCRPSFALTTNGAVLLERGEPDARWLAESEGLVAPHLPELRRLCALLEPNERFIRCRLVDGMYVFAYCADGVDAEAAARACQNLASGLTIQASGRKIYLLPPGLDKGAALSRLRARLNCEETTWCAGDSLMDAPMLRPARTALVPAGFPAEVLEPTEGRRVVVCDGKGLFAEQLLEHILEATTARALP